MFFKMNKIVVMIVVLLAGGYGSEGAVECDY